MCRIRGLQSYPLKILMALILQQFDNLENNKKGRILPSMDEKLMLKVAPSVRIGLFIPM